jgi:hypothetical protein
MISEKKARRWDGSTQLVNSTSGPPAIISATCHHQRHQRECLTQPYSHHQRRRRHADGM